MSASSWMAAWSLASLVAEPVHERDVMWDERAVEHLLSRAGFGALESEIRAGVRMGQEALVDALLRVDGPWRDVEPVLQRWEDMGLDHLQMPIADAEFWDLESSQQVAMCKDARVIDRDQYFELCGRYFGSVIEGASPLRDRMTLFWHGFFTTSIEKNKRKFELIHQFQGLRKSALSSYSELLHAIVEDPAMLQYLDNTGNSRQHPNENFARELLELYSLGEGNYTETDVREAARALTGSAGSSNGRFEFLADAHDPQPKTILGIGDCESRHDLVEVILAQPACARWVARRLLRFMEGVEPSEERVDRYADTLRANGYELRPFLRRLFLDPDFYGEERMGARVSSPLEFLLSTCRKIAWQPPAEFVHHASASMGQALYFPPSVKGWPEGLEWLQSDALARRGNVAGVLVGAIVAPTTADREMHAGAPTPMGRLFASMGSQRWQPPPSLLDRIARLERASDERLAAFLLQTWLSIPPPTDTIELVAEFVRCEREAMGASEGALDPSSPEFVALLRRLAHLIFSLPEAQLS